MITAALGILFVPGEYGRGLLPERYERPTSGMGGTVRGQIVLGGLASCTSLPPRAKLMRRSNLDFACPVDHVSPYQERFEKSARCS
jgi:hypothetical protein